MPSQITCKERVLDELIAIYDGRASGRYGLSLINQRAHAVQSGTLARAQGLSASLVTAALLHDIGHMVHDLGEHPAAIGVDDHHELTGSAWLKCYFGPDVTEPVRLHVAAKRYLCTVDSQYLGRLSGDSIESLALQGGPMVDREVTAFTREPHWEAAVTLRRIDELAKDPEAPMPNFGDFAWEILQAVDVR